MKHRKVCLLIGCLVALLLTSCREGMSFQISGERYTEENMSYFGSEKTAISELSSIEIRSNYADVEMIASDEFYLEYSYYYINNQPELSIEEGKLIFDDSDMNQGGYSISQKQPNSLKLYIPSTAIFDDITITKSSGEVTLGSFYAKQTTIDSSYGDVFLGSCEIENLSITASSGTITIDQSVIGEAELVDSYGGVELEDCSVEVLSASLSSGNMKVSNCSIEEASINNSYGDIKLSLLGLEDDYCFDVTSSYGRVHIGNKTYEGSVLIDRGGPKDMKLTLSSGDVTIKFVD